MGKLARLLDFVDFGEICRGCQVNCCRRFYAILLDEEVEEFKAVAKPIKTRYGIVHTLGDPHGGVCPYLRSDGLCNVYPERPFDCRFWPLMIHYDSTSGEFVIHLDMECPAAREGRIPKELLDRMLKTVLNAGLDENWVKRFTSTPWHGNLKEIARVKSLSKGENARLQTPRP
jgi:Fe-S-cluster containining protein